MCFPFLSKVNIVEQKRVKIDSFDKMVIQTCFPLFFQTEFLSWTILFLSWISFMSATGIGTIFLTIYIYCNKSIYCSLKVLQYIVLYIILQNQNNNKTLQNMFHMYGINRILSPICGIILVKKRKNVRNLAKILNALFKI